MCSPPEGFEEKDGPDWVNRIKSFMSQSDGAYAMVMMNRNQIYGFRDEHGLRPLCIGKIPIPGTDKVTQQQIFFNKTLILFTIWWISLYMYYPNDTRTNIMLRLVTHSHPSRAHWPQLELNICAMLIPEKLFASIRTVLLHMRYDWQS